MLDKKVYLIDTKNMSKKCDKIVLKFSAYEIDLIIKSLAIAYSRVDYEKFIFNNKEKDKTNIFYIQRILGCEANKFFHNKENDCFFKILDN